LKEKQKQLQPLVPRSDRPLWKSLNRILEAEGDDLVGRCAPELGVYEDNSWQCCPKGLVPTDMVILHKLLLTLNMARLVELHSMSRKTHHQGQLRMSQAFRDIMLLQGQGASSD
jgi:hypothetical protein